MFVIHYHNEHAFDNPGQCEIIGPYSTLDAAKFDLAKLVGLADDEHFKVDPNEDAEDNDGTYAGYDADELIEAERDEDLACKIWAEITELTTAASFFKSWGGRDQQRGSR